MDMCLWMRVREMGKDERMKTEEGEGRRDEGREGEERARDPNLLLGGKSTG